MITTTTTMYYVLCTTLYVQHIQFVFLVVYPPAVSLRRQLLPRLAKTLANEEMASSYSSYKKAGGTSYKRKA